MSVSGDGAWRCWGWESQTASRRCRYLATNVVDHYVSAGVRRSVIAFFAGTDETELASIVDCVPPWRDTCLGVDMTQEMIAGRRLDSEGDVIATRAFEGDIGAVMGAVRGDHRVQHA